MVALAANEWMFARIRAITTCMHSTDSGNTGFKRQVVFRVGAEDWQALEAAAKEHGSIQAAVIAGIHALAKPEATAAPPKRNATKARASKRKRTQPVAPDPTPAPQPVDDPNEELRAREAAKLLGLKTSTVSGYIRSGRLPGRYDDSPGWLGWLTTRGAVEHYRQQRG